jgi:hypothetical protein
VLLRAVSRLLLSTVSPMLLALAVADAAVTALPVPVLDVATGSPGWSGSGLAHEVALSFSRAGTSDSSSVGPQLKPHSPFHLALPLACDCNAQENQGY